MTAAMLSVVGMGVPSKYLDLPVASLGKCETVTLKRASRVRPQSTKKVSSSVSTLLRRPMANAQTAGARPKEICCRQRSRQQGLRCAHQVGERVQFLAQHARFPP